MIALLLAQTIAITGGTVYPVSGPKLANASVLIRDGRIVAVGRNVPIPPDATRIDAAGQWITPGLIDGAGQIGLVEISAVPGTRDASVQGDTIAASFNVAEGRDRKSTRLNSSHSQISYAVFCLKKKKIMYRDHREYYRYDILVVGQV